VIDLKFESIYGQPALWQSLKRGFEEGSAVHAFLFVGDRGSGKCTAALVCAAAVLCEEKHKPCGTCKSCRQVLMGVHPDFIRLGTEEKSSIGIDEVRALQAKMEESPYAGERRAVIIENAHTLTVDAQNALLKTLEEPRPGNVLFLLASQESALLSTITSRCLLIRMGHLERSEMLRALKDRGIENERAQHLMDFSGGNLGRALELAQTDAQSSMQARCCELMNGLRQMRQLPKALDDLKDLEKDRAARAEFIETMEFLLLQLLHEKLMPAPGSRPILSRDFTSESIHSMMKEVVWVRKRLSANVPFASAVEPLLKAIIGG